MNKIQRELKRQGYFNIDSFEFKEDANEIAKEFRSNGFRSRVVKINDNWYEVWKGKESIKKEELKAQALKLAKEMGLEDSAIGNTPKDWHYFIIGAKSHKQSAK